MSGCSKRCKLGFVKFAQTIFKLITGTLSKGGKSLWGSSRQGMWRRSEAHKPLMGGFENNSGRRQGCA
ncbi:hypothetical protein FD754_015305 [Muntiacus muntjak]|uniref:Uncharacterized protein n=1 Tax=Muntiacus muntjak TaxID=9888 RepID=A0A5N3VN14_MUNMU|nr:hypothetical protein FD754_015305 [Muntiacus muntjak]